MRLESKRGTTTYPSSRGPFLARGDEARPYFVHAYETLSRDPWLAESEPAWLERLWALGAIS
jgi:hypothetical protein